MKFTFKHIKTTGRYSGFYPTTHDIKLQKKKVGSISNSYPYTISLMVIKVNIREDGNPNCTWKWIILKWESKSVEDAKEFLNEKIDDILLNYNLYKQEK